jgi:hypothetical protein
MKLDAWLRQDRPPSPADRLRFVERLAQALNAVHDRGAVLTALEPLRVEVGNDREPRCDLDAAGSGSPDPRYLAPERREGGPPSAEADVYAAGLIAWETLAGRSVSDPPATLSDVVPDLPQELASAVMACLERSPQWRPKDLTYLAQLAAAHQKVVRRDEPAERAPQPPRAQPPPAPKVEGPRAPARPAGRTSPQRESRSHLPLIAAALLVVAAAAGSYFWFQRHGTTGGAAAPPRPRPVPTSLPLAAATPGAPAPAKTAPAPGATPVPAPATPAPTPTPAREAVPAAATEPTPVPTPTPTPTPTPPPAPPTAATAASAPPPETPPAAPAEPVVLGAVSPLSVRRPGKALLDLRGSGFRSDLRVRVLPLRESTHGISVSRQKWVSASLVTVLLDLDASVSPGAYAIALEDPDGVQTKPLQITVTK